MLKTEKQSRKHTFRWNSFWFTVSQNVRRCTNVSGGIQLTISRVSEIVSVVFVDTSSSLSEEERGTRSRATCLLIKSASRSLLESWNTTLPYSCFQTENLWHEWKSLKVRLTWSRITGYFQDSGRLFSNFRKFSPKWIRFEDFSWICVLPILFRTTSSSIR